MGNTQAVNGQSFVGLQGPGHRHLRLPASPHLTPTWALQVIHPRTLPRAAINLPPSELIKAHAAMQVRLSSQRQAVACCPRCADL